MPDIYIRHFDNETYILAKATVESLPEAALKGEIYLVSAGDDINKLCLCINATGPLWHKRLLGLVDNGVIVYDQYVSIPKVWDGTQFH